MNCRRCGASLSKQDSFCPTCGMVFRQDGDSYDPYIHQAATAYGPPIPQGGMYDPYAPPAPPPFQPPESPSPRRRFSPVFLKGLFSGIAMILLLSGALGTLLILRQGTRPHEHPKPLAAPQPTVHSSVPTTASQPTAPARQVQPCVFAQSCEAENANLSGGEAVNLDHRNYTGTGFVADHGIQGANTTWTLQHVPASASHTLTIRYANAIGGDRQYIARTLSLYVNGSKTGYITFPITADWDTWSTVQQVIRLKSGIDSIALICDPGDSCNVNLDAITVMHGSSS